MKMKKESIIVFRFSKNFECQFVFIALFGFSILSIIQEQIFQLKILQMQAVQLMLK